MKVEIVGAGLAGCEAAYFLAERGVSVSLTDGKPREMTPAHRSPLFAELVCSNSLKSNDALGNACGLLKAELRLLHSLVIEAADRTSVPAGGALAVDREKFSAYITEKIRSHPRIRIEERMAEHLPAGIGIVATGPLTQGNLAKEIGDLFGSLHFYDASAPIVSGDSIDWDKTFVADRYGRGSGDYVNCPLRREEYEAFVAALAGAERAELHAFEKREIFEGCMPVEVMASRGVDTLRYGMLKPVGLFDAEGKRPYAVMQLRKEDTAGSAYNLVGCQTNLRFGEQRCVFGLVPALAHAEYLRYGVMHRNTYLPAGVLHADFSAEGRENLFFAGQITGVEGYVESAMSGLLAGIQVERRLRGALPIVFPQTTVCGALQAYVASPHADFQPMNANYGILAPLEVRDKTEKRKRIAERSLCAIQAIGETL